MFFAVSLLKFLVYSLLVFAVREDCGPWILTIYIRWLIICLDSLVVGAKLWLGLTIEEL